MALYLNHIAWEANLHPTSEVFKIYVRPRNLPLGNSTASPHCHTEKVASPCILYPAIDRRIQRIVGKEPMDGCQLKQWQASSKCRISWSMPQEGFSLQGNYIVACVWL
jgi:hypothetical protein